MYTVSQIYACQLMPAATMVLLPESKLLYYCMNMNNFILIQFELNFELSLVKSELEH